MWQHSFSNLLFHLGVSTQRLTRSANYVSPTHTFWYSDQPISAFFQFGSVLSLKYLPWSFGSVMNEACSYNFIIWNFRALNIKIQNKDEKHIIRYRDNKVFWVLRPQSQLKFWIFSKQFRWQSQLRLLTFLMRFQWQLWRQRVQLPSNLDLLGALSAERAAKLHDGMNTLSSRGSIDMTFFFW